MFELKENWRMVLFIFPFLVFILISVQVKSQKKTIKLLQDSTKELAKQYKLQAQRSVDSFRRVQKRKADSIKAKNNPDTIPFKKSYRLGFDFSKPLNYFLNKTQKNLEFSLDYHARERIFYALEAGYESVNYNVPGYYHYSSSGEYIKAGFDYGIFKVTRRNDNNIVYTGVRLGTGHVQYTADSIQISNGYFGNVNSANISSNSTGFFLEFVFGTKVEIRPRLFLGWSIRLDSRLNNLTNKPNYPIRVPGFGDSLNSQNFNYTYSLFYSF